MADFDLINLDVAHIEDAKSRYHQHPLRLVQIENFLESSIANSVSQLLESHAKFGPIYGLYKTPDHLVEREEWLRAEDRNRFFHYERLSGFGPHKPGEGLQTFLRLRQFLSSDALCKLVQDITDAAITPVTAAHVQRFRQGHYLRPHHDRAEDRKIAFILYLSPDWESQFGGQLTLHGRDGAEERLEPLYNSLVLFDVTHHEKHHIETLTPLSAGRSRYTIGGWMSGGAKL